MGGLGRACRSLLQCLCRPYSALAHCRSSAQLFRSLVTEHRRAHPGEPLNLSGAHLAGADLQAMKLPFANLESVDLRRAKLVEVELEAAVLRGASLDRADLRRAGLHGAYLNCASLWGADLRGADLRAAHMACAMLRSADLRGADLRGADLRWVNLADADLRGTGRFDPQQLGGDLRHALRTRALLVDLNGARLSPEGSFALELILQGVDFSRTSWLNPAGEPAVQFLGPLLKALSGNLQNGPPIDELLQLGFNHWSSEGCSVLTSVDSIRNEPLKVAMMRTLSGSLAERSDAELAPVARPLLDVLIRNPSYLEAQPQLSVRLARLGGIPTPVPLRPVAAAARA